MEDHMKKDSKKSLIQINKIKSKERERSNVEFLWNPHYIQFFLS
jgi:hypothetical protein